MSELFLPLQLQLLLAGMLFFFIGYALAPLAYAKKIKWLTAYPLWVAEKLESWTKKKINPYILFVFILSVNTTSLTLDFLSGWAPGLPILFAVWTGLNVGVITFKTLKGEFYYTALINPVALLELPAVFITFALAFGINAKILFLNVPGTDFDFQLYLNSFIWLVLPLLLIAAFVETALIHWSQKIEQE